ncbi:hypothetical protein [Enhydrobacter sp.]|jgi:hypothetical protein|uniref:hypothetical protein n=1 Tax=Enhydrobacter sp. TaxID=1894999 RepID=UPI002618F6C7|nr:hypothetical protein [Enhydrobacter sp.]WIM09263.1 MAG: hypothetical protein OJF58_000214 [Enhydrobacter sp.]
MGEEEFARRKNIERYETLLAETTEEAERKVLLELLRAEKDKTPPPGGRRAKDC